MGEVSHRHSVYITKRHSLRPSEMTFYFRKLNSIILSIRSHLYEKSSACLAIPTRKTSPRAKGAASPALIPQNETTRYLGFHYTPHDHKVSITSTRMVSDLLSIEDLLLYLGSAELEAGVAGAAGPLRLGSMRQ